MRNPTYLLIAAFVLLGCTARPDVKPEPQRVEARAQGAVTSPCCTWTISPVVTSDYFASIGELVQVDMAGKAAPDIVTINLPDPGPHLGRSIAIVTINGGGAEDGSRLRLRATTQIKPPVDYICDSYNEVFQTVTSAGSYWILSNNR